MNLSHRIIIVLACAIVSACNTRTTKDDKITVILTESFNTSGDIAGKVTVNGDGNAKELETINVGVRSELGGARKKSITGTQVQIGRALWELVLKDPDRFVLEFDNNQFSIKSKLDEGVDWVESLRKDIVGIRGAWEVMIREEGNVGALNTVYNTAPDISRRLLALNPKKLGKEIDQQQWAGYGYYMAADAAFRIGEMSKYKEYIKLAEESINQSMQLLLKADRLAASDSSDAYIQNLQADILRCFDRERTTYLSAMILAIRHFVEKIDNQAEVSKLVKSIDKNRLNDLEVNPKYTPYIKDLIKGLP